MLAPTRILIKNWQHFDMSHVANMSPTYLAKPPGIDTSGHLAVWQVSGILIEDLFLQFGLKMSWPWRW